jgi:thioredoxin-dependent peroxiredoxin
MNNMEIGNKAPHFKGLNQNGKEIKLSDFAGKNLVLYFYPKDSTPGCTAEACDLRDNYEMWISKGYEIIGVSPDSQKSHQKFIEKYNLPFDLISDVDKEILISYNAWGEKSMYGKKYMGVIRKTYLINKVGIIDNIFEKVDTKAHTQQILKVIK